MADLPAFCCAFFVTKQPIYQYFVKFFSQKGRFTDILLGLIWQNGRFTDILLRFFVAKQSIYQYFVKFFSQNGRFTDILLRLISQNGQFTDILLRFFLPKRPFPAFCYDSLSQNGPFIDILLRIFVTKQGIYQEFVASLNVHDTVMYALDNRPYSLCMHRFFVKIRAIYRHLYEIMILEMKVFKEFGIYSKYSIFEYSFSKYFVW